MTAQRLKGLVGGTWVALGVHPVLGQGPTTVAIQGAKGASLQSTPPPQSQHTSVAAKLLEEKSAKLPVRTHSLAFKVVEALKAAG